jgi:hypothetical protein
MELASYFRFGVFLHLTLHKSLIEHAKWLVVSSGRDARESQVEILSGNPSFSKLATEPLRCGSSGTKQWGALAALVAVVAFKLTSTTCDIVRHHQSFKMSDDEYEIPLQDQRVFGAGLKRKRIHFVPSSSVPTTPPSTTTNTTTAGDRYLSIVLSKSDHGSRSASAPPSTTSAHEEKATDDCSSIVHCEICSMPLSSAPEPSHIHEASIAHQVSLEHSHPPSHLDRSRLGLRYLQSQGWDPDSRLGLGVQGKGIQFPIKAKPKDDKMGLGLTLPDFHNGERVVMAKEVPKEKLDAGKVRKLEEKDRRRRQRLQEIFYRNDDVERYLSTG